MTDRFDRELLLARGEVVAAPLPLADHMAAANGCRTAIWSSARPSARRLCFFLRLSHRHVGRLLGGWPGDADGGELHLRRGFRLCSRQMGDHEARPQVKGAWLGGVPGARHRHDDGPHRRGGGDHPCSSAPRLPPLWGIATTTIVLLV